MDKPDWGRLRILAGVQKHRMHKYSAAARIKGLDQTGKRSCAIEISLQVDQSLGLTLYFFGYAAKDIPSDPGDVGFSYISAAGITLSDLIYMAPRIQPPQTGPKSACERLTLWHFGERECRRRFYPFHGKTRRDVL